jgi:hypothetical protein
MKTKIFAGIIIICMLVLSFLACLNASAQQQPQPPIKQPLTPPEIKTETKPLPLPNPCQCLAETKVITFYENDTIPAGIGISTGSYTNVDGYRFINITVEFEQKTAGEKPVSLGVVFAFDAGSPHNKSSYTARLPIMGPYVQVFPFNQEHKARKFTIKAYLST